MKLNTNHPWVKGCFEDYSNQRICPCSREDDKKMARLFLVATAAQVSNEAQGHIVHFIGCCLTWARFT